MPSCRDRSLPSLLNNPLDTLHVHQGPYLLDQQFGRTDDELLGSALYEARKASATGAAPIVLPAREITITETRSVFNGMKIVGKLPEEQ